MKEIIKKNMYLLIMIIILILVKFLLKDNNIYYFMLSFSAFLIFVSSFSHVNITTKLLELEEKEYKYSQWKLFCLTLGMILIINIVYIFLINLINIILNSSEYFINFKYVFLSMGFTIFIIPFINILKQYLYVNDNKKISNLLVKLFYCIWIISVIIVILLNYKIKLEMYIINIVIYLLAFISFIISLSLILLLVKDKSIFSFKLLKKRGENKLILKNYIYEVFCNNISYSIKRIVYISYYYISIIFVYYVIFYRYHYKYTDTINIITNTYFYNFLLVMFFVLIFLVKYRKEIIDVKNKMIMKKCEKVGIDKLFINISRIIFPITLLLCILSKPILILIFNNDNANIFMFFVWIVPFIVIYLVCMFLVENSCSKKKFYITLFSGLFVKIILTIPLINSFYRMGYNLIYGDILSNIIGFFVSFIIGIIYLNNKFEVDFTSSFEKILNIIYENIILCLVLVLSSIIIPLNSFSRLESIGIIIIYISIFLLYFIIKKIIRKYLEGKNEK